MPGTHTKNRLFLIATLGVCLVNSGCLMGGKKTAKTQKSKTEDLNASAEPDKVLYDRAMADMKKARYTEGRLSLQTLINTYPDSEYLAKAKLAQADSYYKEGGTSNLTQSVSEYADFQTFFPFLDEAAYAQMQIGMAHYRMMEKSDRDTTQAYAAEDAFQAFLLKYPQNALAPQAEQHLRDVQEVLADGEFKIASFYFVKQDYRASGARLVEVTDRYPLYSGSDQALWMLGDVYQRAKQLSKNEDDKNHWADLAAKCYDRILRNYPLSKYAQDAKARLTSMGMPVPAADPNAVARMQKQQLYAKAHRPNPLKKVEMDALRSSPDVTMAARSGAPNLNPPTDAVSATDILKPGAAGPTFGVSAASTADSGTADSGTVDEGGGGSSVVSSGGNAPTAAAGAQIIAAPNAVAPGTTAPNTPPSNGPINNAAPANPGAPNQPALATPVNPPASNLAPNNTPPAGTAPPPGQGNATASSTPAAAGTTGQAGTQASGQSSSAQQKDSAADPKQESTSKKKKGIHKLIPW